MSVRRKPVLIPFKWKLRDLIWIVSISILILLLFLLSTANSEAQIQIEKTDFVSYKVGGFSISVPDYLTSRKSPNGFLSPEIIVQ